MKVNTFIKPVLSIFTSALLVLGSVSLAHANTPSGTPVKVQSQQSKADAQLLITSAAGNRLSVIEQLVNEGVDINTPAIGDGTALMIAVKQGNMAMVEGLIKLGADVNQSSPGDGNPLIVASKFNQLNVVSTLLDQGAEIDAIVKGDETALINASKSGHFDVVKLLVEQGADVNLGVHANILSGREFRSPLNQANSSKIRDYLASQGAAE